MQPDDLILRLQQKDEKAFERLYSLYSESIFGVINSVLHDVEASEEVLQDVFIKVWDNCESYSSKKGRFFTWLLNIARNAAIDKTRSKSFKNQKKNLTQEYFVDILENKSSFSSKVDAIGIKKYIKALGEDCKKVINLLFFKGYIQEYIESGILELYVYGALTSKESEEVSTVLKQYPEVEKEVEQIEAALQNLATAAAPYNPEEILAAIKAKLQGNDGVVQLNPASQKRTRLLSFISVAASVIFLIGIFVLLNRTNTLRKELQVVEIENKSLESKLQHSEDVLTQTKEILAVIRDPQIIKVPLTGQQVAPEAYVNVFWDKESNSAYIDAMGLPEPPEGFVYQVWSLKLDPLTPTSMGLLDDFANNSYKIFSLENPNDSQAFGITLEPAGGSETPTMEQLYTLGVVENNA